MTAGRSSLPPAPEPSLAGRDGVESMRDFCLQVFHLAPVGYLIHDPRGLIEDANYTVSSMLGMPAHALRGEPLAQFVSHDDATRVAAHVSHAVLTGQRCELQVRVRRPSGTRFHGVLESISIHPPGAETRVLTTVIDDSDRIRTEARLLEREATLSCVLGAARDAIVGVDEHGAIRAFEGASERVFGHRREEVLGKHVGMLFDVAAPPATRWSSEQPPRARARRRDGASFEAEVTVHRTAGASYAVLCVRDVSRHEELSRALTEAQRFEIAGRLAAGVAHDTNNLLMRILSAADALVDHAEPRVLRDRALELRRAAEGGAAIVRRLASMIGADLHESNEVELDRAIESLRVVLEPMLGPDVALVLRLEATGLRIRCHRGHVEQLVLNLAINARDAMPDGGTLEIATRHAENCASEPRAEGDLPDVRRAPFARSAFGRAAERRLARARDNCVSITVRDDGGGMSEAVRARIFEPSFTTKETGSGLGLVTVASIVQQAGGSIEVESAVGAGTTFRVELPCTRPAPALTRPPRAVRPSTLLLVARDALVRSTLRAHLEGAGHTVLEGADALDALERCREYVSPIHALLLEVGLGGDVADLADRARALHPEASVLFLSSVPRAELVGGGRLASDTFLLHTPCSDEELSDALARVLDPPGDASRVLVVEDDALTRRSLGELLRRRGYVVMLAETIAEAMARHRERPADLIVSDGRLPDGRAIDLLRELRRGGDERPVVVVSGLGPADDRAVAAALSDSRTAFVQKPAEVEELLAAFEALRSAR